MRNGRSLNNKIKPDSHSLEETTLRHANRRDIAAGAVFAVIGAGALLIGSGYDMGRAARMGPGYFPAILGGLLVALGAGIALDGLKGAAASLPRIAWRPLVWTVSSVVLFALLIDRGGLIVSTVGLVILSRVARPGHGPLETAALALILSGLCAAVFHFGLGLQFPLWPRFQ